MQCDLVLARLTLGAACVRYSNLKSASEGKAAWQLQSARSTPTSSRSSRRFSSSTGVSRRSTRRASRAASAPLRRRGARVGSATTRRGTAAAAGRKPRPKSAAVTRTHRRSSPRKSRSSVTPTARLQRARSQSQVQGRPAAALASPGDEHGATPSPQAEEVGQVASVQLPANVLQGWDTRSQDDGHHSRCVVVAWAKCVQGGVGECGRDVGLSPGPFYCSRASNLEQTKPPQNDAGLIQQEGGTVTEQPSLPPPPVESSVPYLQQPAATRVRVRVGMRLTWRSCLPLILVAAPTACTTTTCNTTQPRSTDSTNWSAF